VHPTGEKVLAYANSGGGRWQLSQWSDAAESVEAQHLQLTACVDATEIAIT